MPASTRAIVDAAAPAAEGRVHRALARALGRRARRLGRLHVRRPRARAAADRGVRRRPGRRDRARRPLGVLRRARAPDRRARLPAAGRCAATLPPRGRAALLPASPASASSACSRSGSLAFLLRAEDALQLPFGRLLYGDLSPIASGTRFGQAFIAMTLGFALVAALLFLAWLTEPARAALAGVSRSRSVFALGALAVGPLGGRRRRVVEARSSPTGCTSPRPASGSAASSQLAARRLAARAGAAARRRSCASRGSRRSLVALARRGRRLPELLRLPHARDLWTARYGQRAARQARARLARARVGRPSTTSSSGRGSSAAVRSPAAVAQPARRGVGRDGGAARRPRCSSTRSRRRSRRRSRTQARYASRR